MRRRYVVTYEIRDPKRLRRTFKVMSDYGDHLQLSVFECLLNRSERIQLEDALKDVILQTEDQVLFFDLGRVRDEGETRLRVRAVGVPYRPRTIKAVVI